VSGPTEPPPPPPISQAGSAIITWSWVGTAVFVVTAVIATIFPDGFGLAELVVSLVLFAIGCVVFFWAYAVAVQRSRTDLIGIGGLYFLAGTAPNPVRVRLLGSLAVEVVAAIVTASIRLYSPLAFGFLVPVYGLGFCGLWGARHGTFPPRGAAAEGDEPDGGTERQECS
jgi:hypothetical protein